MKTYNDLYDYINPKHKMNLVITIGIITIIISTFIMYQLYIHWSEIDRSDEISILGLISFPIILYIIILYTITWINKLFLISFRFEDKYIFTVVKNIKKCIKQREVVIDIKREYDDRIVYYKQSVVSKDGSDVIKNDCNISMTIKLADDINCWLTINNTLISKLANNLDVYRNDNEVRDNELNKIDEPYSLLLSKINSSGL